MAGGDATGTGDRGPFGAHHHHHQRRALTNLLLLQTGYEYMPLASWERVIEEHKHGYYLTLRQSQRHHHTASEDITPWVDFFLDSLSWHQQQVQQRLEAVREEVALNERQQRVLAFIRDHAPVAIRQLNESLPDPRPTLKADLTRLLELGFIERRGAGRGTRYVAVPR